MPSRCSWLPVTRFRRRDRIGSPGRTQAPRHLVESSHRAPGWASSAAMFWAFERAASYDASIMAAGTLRCLRSVASRVQPRGQVNSTEPASLRLFRWRLVVFFVRIVVAGRRGRLNVPLLQSHAMQERLVRDVAIHEEDAAACLESG